MIRKANSSSIDIARNIGHADAGRAPTNIDRRRLRRVCAWCKRMADDGPEWSEARWSAAFDVTVTHGICPRCAAGLE